MSKILKSNNKGSLIVISGPSGSGKDSVCERLKEYNDNFWVSISCTTRKPRKGKNKGLIIILKVKKNLKMELKMMNF